MTARQSTLEMDFGRELFVNLRVGGGRFVLRRLLGRGPLSEVWLALDTQTDRDVALKFLPVALTAEAGALGRFEEAVVRQALLGHPHIAATIELVQDQFTTAIASEYVDGWSLEARKVDQPQQRFRVGDVEWWVRQSCAALEYAHHEFGLVHGALQPANLLVSGQDDLKLADFGLAHLARTEAAQRGLLVQSSALLGYLSPQQVMGEELAPGDDVYSFGATLFELLTGTPPFYKGEILAQIRELPAPTVNERLRELGIKDEPVPAVWEATIAACLAKNPAERPSGAVEIQQMLDRAEVTPVTIPAGSPELLDGHTPTPLTGSALAATQIKSMFTPAAAQASGSEASRFQPSSIQRLLSSRWRWAMAVVLLAVVGWFAVWALKHGKSSELVTETTSGVTAPAGSVDTTFKVGDGADGVIRRLAVQADGRILAAGGFTQFDNQPLRRLVRLNPDGSVDSGFTPNPRGNISAIVVQGDGKILIGGDTMVGGGHPRRRVLRLLPDGQVEASFGERPNPYNGEVRALAVQPDGRVLVGGDFTVAFDTPMNRIVRLHGDGARDESFDPGEGAAGTVRAIAVQPDGRIVVAGDFSRFDGVSVGHLVRLNRDGSVDETFRAQPGADGAVLALTIRADGQILVAGEFKQMHGVARTRVARLNRDGTLDSGFDPGAGPDGAVRSIAVQSDGRILIAGDFTSLNAGMCRGVARLQSNGREDMSFRIGGGSSGPVWCIGLQRDGRAIVGGDFPSFDGVACGGIIRLNGGSK